MLSFVHQLTTGRVVFGAGALCRVPELVRELGARRVLLIGGGHAARPTDRIAAELGEPLAGRITEVVQHVPAPVAGRAIRAAIDLDADLLLCVGGGSATGLAKAVARERGTPILAVPTTYAGSEMSSIWGLTEGGRKSTGRDPRVLPRVVVYDPELTLSMPTELTATSGMNALAHAVEARYAAAVSPIVALIAEEAIRALSRALPLCVAHLDDLRARSEAFYGAFLSGVTLGNATMGLHHKICHVLGGAYRLPHGAIHSAVLPYATAYSRSAAGNAMHAIATAMGTADPAVGLWELARRIGAPTGLGSIGFDPADIDRVTADVLATPPVNPRPVTSEGVRELLALACAGEAPTTAG